MCLNFQPDQSPHITKSKGGGAILVMKRLQKIELLFSLDQVLSQVFRFGTKMNAKVAFNPPIQQTSHLPTNPPTYPPDQGKSS